MPTPFSTSEPLFELQTFCIRNALPWTELIEKRFTIYIEVLEHFNRAMNLIGPLNRVSIIRELLIDSLLAAVTCAPQGSMIDVGCGAGLPGLPLKILFDRFPLTLVEPRKKRVTFLRIAVQRLELEDVSILAQRIEDAPVSTYAYVISKAFQPPQTWLQTALPLCDSNGSILCLNRDSLHEELCHFASSLGLELFAQSALTDHAQFLNSDADESTSIRSDLATRACFAFRSIQNQPHRDPLP